MNDIKKREGYSKSKSRSKQNFPALWLGILALVGFIVAVGFGFLWYTSQTTIDNSQATLDQINSVVSVVPVEPRESWEELRAEDFGVFVTYPSDISLKAETVDQMQFESRHRDVVLAASWRDMTLADLKESLILKQSEQSAMQADEYGVSPDVIVSFALGARQALYFETNSSDGNIKNLAVQAKNRNTLIVSRNEKSEGVIGQDTFFGIVRAIKTEFPEPEDPTADWEEFASQEFGFELRFPADELEASEDEDAVTLRFLDGEKFENITVALIELGDEDVEDVIVENTVFDPSGESPESIEPYKKNKIGENLVYFIQTSQFEGQYAVNLFIPEEDRILKIELVSEVQNGDWMDEDYSVLTEPRLQLLNQIIFAFEFVD